MPAPVPSDELDRLADLHSCGVLDIESDPSLETIVNLGAKYFDAPICHIAMVDGVRAWLKAKVGLEIWDVPRDESFCAHTILGEDLLIVEDATQDARFADNPVVAGAPHVRFYAGAPINTRAGSKIGSLCLMDTRPRTFEEKDLPILKSMAAMAAQNLLARKQLNDTVAALAGVETVAKERALLLSQVSHELKTPLNQIIGFSEIMEGELFGPMGNAKYQDYARIIGHSSRHLNTLVDAALNIGKANYGVGLHPETLELNGEIKTAAEAFKLAAAQRSQTFVIETTDQPIPVQANRRALRQIVTNLVSNAIKYCPPRSTIRIVAKRDDSDGRGVVVVADDGRGIPDNVMRSLGKPFVRAVNSQVEGSGLGLHLSKSLAEAMGAAFTVKSTPGGSAIALGLSRADAGARLFADKPAAGAHAA